MKKLTKKMQAQLDSGKNTPWTKDWDSGASFNVSIDWDAEHYVISAKEVEKALKEYLKKWPARKKLVKDIAVSINFTR